MVFALLWLLSEGLIMTKLNDTDLFVELYITYSQFVIQDRSFEELGLSRLESMTLSNICRRPGISMSALANLIGVSRPQITGIVEKLVQIELVRREKNRENRRFYNIYGTDKGNEFFNRRFQVIKNLVDDKFENLTGEELEKLKIELEDSLLLMTKAKILPEDFISPFDGNDETLPQDVLK